MGVHAGVSTQSTDPPGVREEAGPYGVDCSLGSGDSQERAQRPLPLHQGAGVPPRGGEGCWHMRDPAGEGGEVLAYWEQRFQRREETFQNWVGYFSFPHSGHLPILHTYPLSHCTSEVLAGEKGSEYLLHPGRA